MKEHQVPMHCMYDLYNEEKLDQTRETWQSLLLSEFDVDNNVFSLAFVLVFARRDAHHHLIFILCSCFHICMKYVPSHLSTQFMAITIWLKQLRISGLGIIDEYF